MKNSKHVACPKCRNSKSPKEFYEVYAHGQLHPWCKDCLQKQLIKNTDLRSGLKSATQRACSQCQLTFSVNSFHWIKSSKTRHSYCRACHAAYMALRYARVSGKK